jgi:molecular chaperone GrpE
MSKEEMDKESMSPDSVPFPDSKRGVNDGGTAPAEAGCCCGGGKCECADKAAGIPADMAAKIDAILAENASLRDLLAHSVADFDNYRKRSVREKEDARRTANADFVAALIPVLDTMALAIDAARKHHPEASGIVDGIDMIVTQLKNTLKGQGVEAIQPAPGAEFDPNLHESIAHQPSDTVPEGAVSAVVRTGYSLNGRLIRPASVVLSSGKAK